LNYSLNFVGAKIGKLRIKWKEEIIDMKRKIATKTVVNSFD